jgi:hypothetical protein
VLPHHVPMTDLTVRFATAADDAAVTALARLDSAQPLTGAALVAESGGRLVAATSLTDGRVVADPFLRTAAVVELLRVRARQVAAPDSRPRWWLGQRPRLAVN